MAESVTSKHNPRTAKRVLACLLDRPGYCRKANKSSSLCSYSGAPAHHALKVSPTTTTPVEPQAIDITHTLGTPSEPKHLKIPRLLAGGPHSCSHAGRLGAITCRTFCFATPASLSSAHHAPTHVVLHENSCQRLCAQPAETWMPKFFHACHYELVAAREAMVGLPHCCFAAFTRSGL